jgi:Sulfatase-modifying factor enzyme 1
VIRAFTSRNSEEKDDVLRVFPFERDRALASAVERFNEILLHQPTPNDKVHVSSCVFGVMAGLNYTEEAPAHRVKAAPFWIDFTQVTNRQFREFIWARGYVTFVEIGPALENYPAAEPHMVRADTPELTPHVYKIERRTGSNGGGLNSPRFYNAAIVLRGRLALAFGVTAPGMPRKNGASRE